jgi:hypothetical protein
MKEERMRNRVAVLPSLIAVALLAGGPALTGASPGKVVKGGVDLVATGKVVSKTSDKLVLRTDDHGHKITFDVDNRTALPDGLAVGRHVRVEYRANGSTGQTAEQVSVVR